MARYALALGALVLALVAGGCDDDPEPKIADPTSEATSESPSEPPTSEPTPEPVRLSPVETVRSWIDGQNEALLTGDFTSVDAVTLPSCRTCTQFLDPMRDVFNAGGRFETKPWRIAAIESRGDEGAPNDVTVGVVVPGGVTYPAADADPIRYKTERSIMRFKVGRDSDGASGISKLVFLS